MIAPQYGIKPVPRMAADNPAPCPPDQRAKLAELRAQHAAAAEALRRQAPDVWR